MRKKAIPNTSKYTTITPHFFFFLSAHITLNSYKPCKICGHYAFSHLQPHLAVTHWWKERKITIFFQAERVHWFALRFFFEKCLHERGKRTECAAVHILSIYLSRMCEATQSCAKVVRIWFGFRSFMSGLSLHLDTSLGWKCTEVCS